jgi:D-sedoheptulose 7-phosphate isomerase
VTGPVAERALVLDAFLATENEHLAAACHALARSFSRGGTLIAHGCGGARSDAAHVAVEFLHPVIVGKRALPAVSLSDPGDLGAVARGDDIVLALAHGPAGPDEAALLADARRRGLLTLAMAGGDRPADADFAFTVPSDDPAIVQEVQETAYHVLWELVHVFFEHPGLLEEPCLTCGDVAVQARVVALAGSAATVELGGAREDVAVDLVADELAVGDVVLCHAGVALERVSEDPTAFLYPFLDGSEDDLGAVVADVAASTVSKGADTTGLRATIDLQAVQRCATHVKARLEAGGRVLAFGNGGSATDAQDFAYDARTLGWPALALGDDSATVTAVANDVGFENAFSRQIIALGGPGDVALAISTSGSSPSVVAGLEEAQRRGMTTVALLGYDGGRAARLPGLDHVIVIAGDYIPRLQEAQATVYHLLLDAIGRRS